MPSLLNRQTLPFAWQQYQELLSNIKDGALEQKNLAAAGGVPGSTILNYSNALSGVRNLLDAIAARPKLQEYVASLPDTPVGFVVADQQTATRAQITAVVDLVASNATLLERTFDATARRAVDRVFTAGQLASYRTALDALLTAIG